MPEVRPATLRELPAVGRVLAAAFAGDPLWSWMASPRADWDARAAAWFAAEAKIHLAGAGEVLVDHELGGAAIWAGPDHWKVSPMASRGLLLPSLGLFRGRSRRALAAVTTLERHHPEREPHWYLAILGTDPSRQGRGVGSALIRAVTDRCDEQGLGAYLESSKEENVAFYARHGFEVRRELPLRGGPPLWLMWRDAAG